MMGLLHEKERIEKSANKCGGRVLEDARLCSNLN